MHIFPIFDLAYKIQAMVLDIYIIKHKISKYIFSS